MRDDWGRVSCANAAIKWSTFQTWTVQNRTWKVKGTKTTAELEVNRLWHYRHSVLYCVEMEIWYHVEIMPVEMDSLNIVKSPWKVLEKSLDKRSSNLYESCNIWDRVLILHFQHKHWNEFEGFERFAHKDAASRKTEVFLHTLCLENKAQIDQNSYRTMLFMSKQVSLPKISLILQKIENWPKTDICPFCRLTCFDMKLNVP